MSDSFRDQLAKDMTRKQFLHLMAGAVLTVFGFSNLLNLLTAHGTTSHSTTSDSGRHGFGSSKFGV